MKQDSKILVIDDNKDVLVALKLLLQEHFNRVDTFKSPNVLPGQLRKESYDAIILDMNFVAGTNTGNEGFYWLNKVFECDREAAVLFLTAYADVEKAVEAIQQGAVDYIEKPWDDEKLVASVFEEGQTGKKIILRWRVNQHDRPCLEVQDNGPGMSPDLQEKIFVPFYTTKKDGSGIGLNLARQIMLQHRGRIGLSSSFGEGTTFRLEF